MPVNRDRIVQNLERIARFGMSPAGINRYALTREEREAVGFVSGLMTEAGMRVSIDPVGNLIGRLEGTEPDLPAVVVGSHLDTVPNGGKYDGALGVVAGLEVTRALQEDGLRPRHPLEVIAFVNEEGHRFQPGLFGSHAFSQGVTADMISEIRDDAGVSFSEALRQCDLDPAKVHLARRNPLTVKAFIELHVEQGCVLEEANVPAGIVTGITGMVSARLTITGSANHAGTTPMAHRKDALAAAAEVVLLVERVARNEAGPRTVATVGVMRAEPGASNVIAGKVHLDVDLRDINEAVISLAMSRIETGLQEICGRRSVTGTVSRLEEIPPCILPERMVQLLKRAFARQGQEAFTLPSGAAHDAMNVARLTDVGMIFVRSKRGISHSPDEYSSPEDIETGVRVLLDAVKDLCGP